MTLVGLTVRAGEVATFQPEDPGADDPEYFPVPVVGSVKEFQVTMTVEQGKLQQGKLKEIIEKVEDIQGHTYLKQAQESVNLDDWDREVDYLRYAADGIHVIDPNKKTVPESIFIPFPVGVGKKWTRLDQSSGEILHCKAEAVEDLKIGDQVYKNCLRISESQPGIDGEAFLTEMWYAPHLGQVKILLQSGPTFRVELLLINAPSTTTK